MKYGDWSQDVLAVVHNGVFVSKMQFDPIKLQFKYNLILIDYHQQPIKQSLKENGH